jgi:hypothetical protein
MTKVSRTRRIQNLAKGFIFDGCFDILREVKSNEIPEVFGGYIEIFILMI